MTTSRASYDAEADAIGIYFGTDGSVYDGSEEVAPGLVLDYDKDGRIIGVEILGVSRLLATGRLPAIEQAPHAAD